MLFRSPSTRGTGVSAIGVGSSTRRVEELAPVGGAVGDGRVCALVMEANDARRTVERKVRQSIELNPSLKIISNRQ